MRKIGRMGEYFFGIWCASVNLTANSSEVDETGWDFVVEFPSVSNDKLPRDILPAPIECKVQVKSTDGKRKGEYITLSNLERFVKAKLPTFFCFIEFQGKDEPQAAYLVHVGKEIIEKTLKKIRELDSKGEGNRLNKHTMLISYTNNDRLLAATGENLKSAIEKFAPESLEKYILEKNYLLETLGFENGKMQFTIEVSGKDSLRGLIDLSLGLRDEIHLDRSFGYYKRFDILSKNLMFTSENSTFSIQAKSTPVILKFKENRFSQGVTLKAQLYRSPFNKFFRNEYIKLRVKSAMLEIIIEPFIDGGTAKYSFDFSEKRKSLKDLKDHLAVINLLEKRSHSSVLEISDEAGEFPAFSLGAGAVDEIGNWSDIYMLTEMASSICQRFSISEEEVMITPDELAQNSLSICKLHSILCTDSKTVYINFPVGFEDFVQEIEAAFISLETIIIGSHKITYFLAIVGSIFLINSNQYGLTAKSIFVGNELIAVNEELIDQVIIDKGFDDFEKELQSMGLKTIRVTLNKP